MPEIQLADAHLLNEVIAFRSPRLSVSQVPVESSPTCRLSFHPGMGVRNRPQPAVRSPTPQRLSWPPVWA